MPRKLADYLHMSSSQKAGGGEELSPLQIFALATLYYQESKQREKEETVQ